MICCDHAVRKVATAEVVRQFPLGAQINGFAVSPDEQALLLGGSSGEAGLWNLTTGKHTLGLQGLSEPCRAATFSPDGFRAVTTTLDGPTRLWDVTTGRELLTLPGDAGRHAQVAFSPDSRFLLMIYDGQAHILPSALP